MAGLQRSVQTFRRSGSSGLVWDERFLTEGGAEEEKAGDGGAEQPRPELRHSRSVGSVSMLRRGRDEAGDDDDDKKRKVIKPKQKFRKKQGGKEEEEEEVPGKKAFRTRDVAPAADPPSPRVSGCVLCAIFRGSGGGGGGMSRRARPRKR